MTIAVPQIIALLEKYEPSRLEELRKRFPSASAAAILRPGSELGEESPAGTGTLSTALDPGLEQVRCEAALASMEVAVSKLEPLSQHALDRLRRSRSWEASGTLLSTVGTGTAVATLWPSAPATTPAYWASVAALIGALIALAPKLLRKPLTGTTGDISTLLVEAQDVRGRSDQSLPLLRYLCSQPHQMCTTPTAQKAIDDAQALAGRAWQLLLQLS